MDLNDLWTSQLSNEQNGCNPQETTAKPFRAASVLIIMTRQSSIARLIVSLIKLFKFCDGKKTHFNAEPVDRTWCVLFHFRFESIPYPRSTEKDNCSENSSEKKLLIKGDNWILSPLVQRVVPRVMSYQSFPLQWLCLTCPLCHTDWKSCHTWLCDEVFRRFESFVHPIWTLSHPWDFGQRRRVIGYS